MTQSQSATDRLWQATLNTMPLIAILRGISPNEALDIGNALLDSGITIMEVPLNSPSPLETISILSREFGQRAIVGAGTVLTTAEVAAVHAAGGKIIVAPNFSSNVASAAVGAGLHYCPGIATPTEAFQAIDAGASALKLFPAELVTPPVLKAMRAVLPESVTLLPVGGITPDNMTEYLQTGASGFGIGSALYKPGDGKARVAENATRFTQGFAAARESML